MKSLLNLAAFLLVSAAVYPSNAFAQEAASGGVFGGGMPMLIIIFLFFYLFLIRPQQKKAKAHQALLNALKRDDRVITSGGIYATVTAVRGALVDIKIADGVNIQVAKQSISAVITKQDEEAATIPEIIKK
jgi:preprotein translocase, YajC subunit